jgi:hypothetical protein
MLQFYDDLHITIFFFQSVLVNLKIQCHLSFLFFSFCIVHTTILLGDMLLAYIVAYIQYFVDQHNSSKRLTSQLSTIS